MRFISPSKKNKITTVNVLPLLLPHFAPIFTLSSVVLLTVGRKNISWSKTQDTLATALRMEGLKFKSKIGQNIT